jgi:peptide deformylase
MSLRQILIHPDPHLKKVCKPVDEIDEAIHALADDMLETMYDAPGIGLAAPQVGHLVRLFVMDCSAKDEDPEPMVLINPEVTWVSEETSEHDEGCLSVPEVYEMVTRPRAVKVRFIDLDGVERREEFEALMSTCAQHEIDHLNGKLFIDYLSSLKRRMITQKMKKLKKERERP